MILQILHLRFAGLWLALALTAFFLGCALSGAAWAAAPALLFGLLFLIALRDVTQTHHAILRNYPILGHLRFLFEKVRPEIRQYFIESDHDEAPFTREARSMVYQRSKGVEDKRPFGTMEQVYAAGYTWLTHSMAPLHQIIMIFASRSAARGFVALLCRFTDSCL